ncbi:MAG: DNA-directed RNA polymerase subunit RpoH/Rpb5 C-terminal domain-containing protein [Nanoarchaeota archaeon]|nr:DNA-directed RNA polymerase subunit RpoH/Rpb5 C-terminal domain-containing protein [Nanoarchaeota archaeon]
MHILQPKHLKVNEKEAQEILSKLNLSKVQIPKILASDPGLPEGSNVGDLIKIERKEGDKFNVYFRIVVPA